MAKAPKRTCYTILEAAFIVGLPVESVENAIRRGLLETRGPHVSWSAIQEFLLLPKLKHVDPEKINDCWKELDMKSDELILEEVA